MKYESNNFQFEAEMPWESAGEGIVRQIMGYNDNLMMVKVKFETGAIGTPHTHPHTQAKPHQGIPGTDNEQPN